MFRSEESNETCRLPNNTVYELQSIKFSTTFKHKVGGITKSLTSYFSAKLQMNYRRSFNKALVKSFSKMSFKDFGN